jgi:TonB family protein
MVSHRVIAFVCGALFISACATHNQHVSLVPKTRTPESIRRTFDQSARQAAYQVYSNSLKTHPGLKGRVVIRLTIAASGSVVQAEIVESSFNDPKFESSMRELFTKLDFGAVGSPENMTIAIPIEVLAQ